MKARNFLTTNAKFYCLKHVHRFEDIVNTKISVLHQLIASYIQIVWSI